MHTLELAKGRGAIHHNSDLSGDVILVVPAGQYELRTIQGKTFMECRVPGDGLLQLVAEHIRMERISALEQMNTKELLGLSE